MFTNPNERKIEFENRLLLFSCFRAGFADELVRVPLSIPASLAPDRHIAQKTQEGTTRIATRRAGRIHSHDGEEPGHHYQ